MFTSARSWAATAAPRLGSADPNVPHSPLHTTRQRVCLGLALLEAGEGIQAAPASTLFRRTFGGSKEAEARPPRRTRTLARSWLGEAPRFALPTSAPPAMRGPVAP